jgi:hypothetical protein
VKHDDQDGPSAGLIDSSIYTSDPTLSQDMMASKVAAFSSRTTHIQVRTFTDSSGGASTLSGLDEQQEQQQQLARPGSSASQDSASNCEEWYDCVQDWQEDPTTTLAAATSSEQQQIAEELFAELPADLAHILRRYIEVRHATGLEQVSSLPPSPPSYQQSSK